MICSSNLFSQHTARAARYISGRQYPTAVRGMFKRSRRSPSGSPNRTRISPLTQFARLVEQLNKQIKSLPFDREALKRMVHAGELCKSKLEYNLEIQAMPVLKSDSGLFEQACHG